MLLSYLLSLLPFLAVTLADGGVVGGVPVDIADYPYVVALENDGTQVCDGTIISPDQILTAGHCVSIFTANDLVVRSGSSFRVSGGYLTRVKSFRLHPKFNINTVDYDVAVIKLEKPLAWGSPIPIQKSGEKLGPDAEAVVAGWGSLLDNGIQPGQLYAVTVPFVNHDTCKRDYPDQVTDRMICFGKKGKDACHGDSGGGIYSGGRVVGIVSWGKGCAAEKQPGVYTDVSNLEIHDFITQGQ